MKRDAGERGFIMISEKTVTRILNQVDDIRREQVQQGKDIEGLKSRMNMALWFLPIAVTLLTGILGFIK